MKSVIYLLAPLVVLFHTALSQNAREITFQHLTTDNGLSHNTVFDINQDKNGFIWVATSEGLNRYDSNGFKVYYSDSTTHSIPSNEVRSLLVTRQGNLLVGTTEGMCQYRPAYDDFVPALFEGKQLGQVRDICETSQHSIMIASETGVYYLSEDGTVEKRLPLEGGMIQLQEDSLGNFWSIKRQRLFNFDKDGNVLDIFRVRQAGMPEFLPSAISNIYVDSGGQLWIGTFRDGPVLYNPEKKEFIPLPLKESPGKNHPMYFVRDILEVEEGIFWIGTEKGLFIYNRESEDFEQFLQSFDPTVASINDNAIYKIFKSRENILWLGTYFGGLNYHRPVFTGFKSIKPGIKSGELQGKAISQIMEGPGGELWMATEDAGIAIFNPEDQTFRHLLNFPNRRNTRLSHNIHALITDQNGDVWTGNFFGGINHIDPEDYSIRNYVHIPGDSLSLVNNFVFSLYNDTLDNLWVGTMNGVDLFDKETETFSRFKQDTFQQTFIYDIFRDPRGDFWFCTNNNYGLYRYHPQTDKITHFTSGNTPELTSDSYISHHIDTRGKLWFGSRGGGLVFFDPDTDTFRTYDMHDGLPNNVIYGILEDDENNLWLSSNKGISKFNYVTGEIRNFTVDHGLVGTQFNYKSYLKTDDGTMYFGAVNGLTYFHPHDIRTFKSEPEIHFTDFSLFNEPVKPGNKSVLKKDINSTDQITLRYNQNIISFDFIALDFYSRGKNNYYYFMEGFDSTWQSGGDQQNATYTNLPPGEYTFRVKATNMYDFPNELERKIDITILPPPWKTHWAYLGYTILLGLLLFLIYRFNEIRQKEKISLNIERIEKEKLQELHQHKINFFTYISHEFKTPLTIILSALDSLFSDHKVPDRLADRAIVIRRNVLRLQFLINQLMDFRKIETDHAKINIQRSNVVYFLKELLDAFAALFKRKNLEYHFVTSQNTLNIPFDPDKIEKIVSNLLSNAFKYTPKHGEITLKVDYTEESNIPYLIITVSDTGIGMSEKQLNKVFDLFYKIESSQQDYYGSGIGLTLTRSLVKYLNGTISVTSKSGEGSSFTVKLPCPDNVPEEKEDAVIVPEKQSVENLLSQSVLMDENKENPDNHCDFELLLVEDNKDLQKFLFDYFKDYYKVTTASNGAEALEQVKRVIPDLIITDLMMPEMDGIALCKNLKSEFEYCHVPVIMLTAKSDVESKIESLEVGADIYLSKPFLLSELELHIRNIFTSRSNLKKHFIQFGNIDMEQPLKNKDHQFIEKISSIVIENLDNTEFGVQMLTKKLGIGRTLLHTKLKQILDLSATEFINTIRIKEARKIIMDEPETMISEVAYKVGFNDPNYFSRTFKKIFQISPTDFRNKRGKNKKT